MVGERPRPIVMLLWAGILLLAGMMSAEILFTYRSAIKEAYAADDRTAIARLRRAYEPFTVQHLHPFYLFFFPLQPVERLRLANAVCSLDADGFREPGPAAAAGRKIAVMLGGSAAFGHYASSNATTITSQLNRLQDEYFFVNAGVPSWNSTQELARLAMQVLDLKPALVVAYDGANDAVLTELSSGSAFPAGTPESFDRLQGLVDDIRKPGAILRLRPVDLFPELANRFEKYRERWFGTAEPERALPEPGPGARRYVGNLTRMADLSRGAGARFIAVFQPLAPLHRHVDRKQIDREPVIEGFHHAVLALSPGFEFHDFSSVFDQEFATVPVAIDDDLTPETIFVDPVHLTDRGNELIARRLLQLVRQPATARGQ